MGESIYGWCDTMYDMMRKKAIEELGAEQKELEEQRKKKLLNKEIKKSDNDEEDDGEDDAILQNSYVKIRFLLSFIVNCLMFGFLMHTVHLQLLDNEDGMDYVKDCLAVGFIVQLDDVDEEETKKVKVFTKEAWKKKREEKGDEQGGSGKRKKREEERRREYLTKGERGKIENDRSKSR